MVPQSDEDKIPVLPVIDRLNVDGAEYPRGQLPARLEPTDSNSS